MPIVKDADVIDFVGASNWQLFPFQSAEWWFAEAPAEEECQEQPLSNDVFGVLKHGVKTVESRVVSHLGHVTNSVSHFNKLRLSITASTATRRQTRAQMSSQT